jgi:ribosomal-protein-alanine N-acetyltransferase
VSDPTTIEEPFGPPILAVGAFHLRPIRLDDAAAWFDYLRVPGVIEHTSFPAADLDSVRGWIERALADYANQGPYRWALADSGDVLVGTCGFPTWSRAHGHAELGYDLDPRYQHRGLMALAVDAVVRWAFGHRFHRVHAFVMTSNRPSIALLERCGFEREGTLRAYRIARGAPRDFHLYARVSDAPDPAPKED